MYVSLYSVVGLLIKFLCFSSALTPVVHVSRKIRFQDM